jgi:hypothetical protein
MYYCKAEFNGRFLSSGIRIPLDFNKYVLGVRIANSEDEIDACEVEEFSNKHVKLLEAASNQGTLMIDLDDNGSDGELDLLKVGSQFWVIYVDAERFRDEVV